MDRPTLKRVREHLAPLLEQAGQALNLDLRLGNATYRDSTATFKLEISDLSESGEAITKEADDFKRQACFFGLSPEDLGKTFTDFTGKTYKIVGLKPRSTKYPILVERDGKTYKMPERQVRAHLQRQ